MHEPDEYSVFVYATPMSFPLHFTLHTWIEITYQHKTQRYDLWAYPGLKTATKHKGYIYKNIFPNHLGTTFSPFANTNRLSHRQIGRALCSISGAKGSLAHKLYSRIERFAFAYPLHDQYRMILGPNCNTYTQWLLELLPESTLTLPKTAWGRGYTKNIPIIPEEDI